MKIYKFIIFLCLILNFTCVGQTNIYKPFPNDSAVWMSISTNSIGDNSYNVTEWLGDTIINGNPYKKMYDIILGPSLQYKGGMRQDLPNERTYFIDLNNKEHDVTI